VALFLGEHLDPGDQVVVTFPYDAPVIYYARPTAWMRVRPSPRFPGAPGGFTCCSMSAPGRPSCRC